jgi:hypothetical protein
MGLLLRVSSFEVSRCFWDIMCLLANSEAAFYNFSLLVEGATFHEFDFSGKMAVQGSYDIGGVTEGEVGCTGFTTSAHSLSIKIYRKKKFPLLTLPPFRLHLFPQREGFFITKRKLISPNAAWKNLLHFQLVAKLRLWYVIRHWCCDITCMLGLLPLARRYTCASVCALW